MTVDLYAFTAFLIAVLGVGLVNSQGNSLAITKHPMSRVVPRGTTNVTFYCEVRGQDIEWRVNGSYDTLRRNRELKQMGVKFYETEELRPGVLRNRITLPATLEFNSTELICIATTESSTLESKAAYLTIADSPLSPAPTVFEINSTVLEVMWDKPFTWEQFPILHYTMVVHNSSNPTIKKYRIDNESHSQILILEAEAEICSKLTFEVKAANEIGSSNAGTTSGGFPVVPKVFPSEPEVDITFTSDGTPVVVITFMPPEVCSFQNANYSLEFFHAGDTEPFYEMPHKPLVHGENVKSEEIEADFLANSYYYTIITFETELTQISANISFNTAFQPTVPEPVNETTPTMGPPTIPTEVTNTVPHESTQPEIKQPEGLDNEDAGAGSLGMTVGLAAGGCVVVVLLLGIIIVVIILFRRQLNIRSKEKNNTMVENPLYEGPIYEVISEGKTLKPLIPKTKVHAQESFYLDNPAQSLPRDLVAPYGANGVLIASNMAVETKLLTMKMEGMNTTANGESNLDRGKYLVKQNFAASLAIDSPIEDAYTFMSPAVSVTQSTCCKNPGAKNGEMINGRYTTEVNCHCSQTLV